MNWRAFARVAVLLAVANVVLALAVLWGLSAFAPPAGRPLGGTSMAVQRLAEVYAKEAFRYVITHDYAALNVIIRQTASWPELVYVGVEDAQGRILAHSDQTRVGQVWNAELARTIRSTVKVTYDEVVAVMSDPSSDARTKGPIGRVRLGFIADPTPQPLGTAPPAAPLWAALAAAGILAVPMALLAVWLGGRRAAPAEAEPEQVTRLVRELKETATEAQRLRAEQGRHADETARLQREREALAEEVQRLERRAEEDRAAAAELERGRAESDALRRELDDRAAETAALRAELDREQEARAAPELTPAVSPEAANGLDAGGAVRRGQYRAVGHIGQVFRHSLTTILGFSRLLLRSVDGELNARQRTDVENIQRAGDELLGFINAMAELSRADLGSLPRRRETASLGQLLTEAARATDVSAAVEVMLDADDPGLVAADPAHVGRALHLLLQHAVGDVQGGSVVATARSHGSVASVEVAYPRPPITTDEAQRLFDPFVLSGAPAGAGDVARVRLALARSLTALNGGQLSVEAGDRSIVFSLTLPRPGDHPDESADGAGRPQETARR
ncbi:MAG: hypothetical protein ACREM3_07665 [Candidatus Rokuibacteriota bacterium]